MILAIRENEGQDSRLAILMGRLNYDRKGGCN